jgi:tetratricopeptide (TPR) repeat protein
MKKITLYLACILWAAISQAQPKPYKPNPKAKKLEDSAIHLFQSYDGQPKSTQRIESLLQGALKTDPKWYEGWANLLSFQGRTEQLDKCYATAQKMAQQFPQEPDALLNLGVMQHKMGHKPEAIKTFEKLVKILSGELAKNSKDPHYNDLLTQKGIALILANKVEAGKALLNQLYQSEQDSYKKSYIAFYVNKSREEIIEDRVPGH